MGAAVTIRPSGEEVTMTREALLAAREKDAARLRALWAQEKADKKRERGNRAWEIPSVPTRTTGDTPE